MNCRDYTVWYTNKFGARGSCKVHCGSKEAAIQIAKLHLVQMFSEDYCNGCSEFEVTYNGEK